MHHPRGYLTRFGMTLGLLMLLPVAAAWNSASFRGSEAVPLETLAPNEVFVTLGASQKQNVAIKIGYAEKMPAPKVGLFGGHQGQNWEASFLGPDEGEFFNYFYLIKPSLFELRDLLYYLASVGKLPTETVIVHVFTPATEWGRRFVAYQDANPLDVTLHASSLYAGAVGKVRHGLLVLDAVVRWVQGLFSYQSVLSGALGGGGQLVRLDMEACTRAIRHEATPLAGWRWAIFKMIPVSVLVKLGLLEVRDFCRHPELHTYLDYAIYRDGTTVYAPFLLGVPPTPYRPLDRRDRLRFGDEDDIAQALREMDGIVAGAGRRLVFYIPPLYRSGPYVPGPVDDIVDRAMAMVPGISVIDHRPLMPGAHLALDRMHFKAEYYHALIAEMRQRGLLGPVAGQNRK
ncbi:MAG: hypothetical protein H7841_00620 [Magnetospirillum sp. WYHS-4]